MIVFNLFTESKWLWNAVFVWIFVERREFVYSFRYHTKWFEINDALLSLHVLFAICRNKIKTRDAFKIFYSKYGEIIVLQLHYLPQKREYAHLKAAKAPSRGIEGAESDDFLLITKQRVESSLPK